jgi:DNA-binding CsgD family transcriptional regulator
VAAGQSLLDPTVTAKVLDRLRRGPEEEPGVEQLSDQERRILDLLAEGLTNRQIGERLYLAEKTVKNYVSNLLMKLGMHRRTEAAVYAARLAERRGPRLADSRSERLLDGHPPLDHGALRVRRADVEHSVPAGGPGLHVVESMAPRLIRSRRADPIVGDAQRHVGGVDRDHDLDVAGAGVTGHVAQRLAQSRQHVGRHGLRCSRVDRALEEHSRLEPKHRRRPAREVQDAGAHPIAVPFDSRFEPKDCRADVLDGQVELVDRVSTRRTAVSGSPRMSPAAPCSDSPVAKSRWTTVS